MLFPSGRAVKTFKQLLSYCVGPSLFSLHDQIVVSVFIGLLYHVVVRIGKLPMWFLHCFSATCGLVVLYFGLLGWDILIHVSVLASGYIVLFCSFKMKKLRGTCGDNINPIYFTQFVCVLFLVWGEFLYPDTEMWVRSRGIAMLAVMKVISMAADFSEYERPTMLQYTGYVLCPANCLLGPWTTYAEYARVFVERQPLNFKWLRRIFLSSIYAVIFLSISNCFAEHYLPEHNDWIEAYKKAMCFRTSHYFVSYLGEAVMLISGYSEEYSNPENNWSYVITNPYHVELPRSLSTVVVYWNMPMHRFLKTYIYVTYLQYSKALAILATYLYSAFLHGFNIQIGLVLLSLGGFSYIQAVSQYMASILCNACIRIKPCVECQHRFTKYHPITLLLNFIFMIFNIAHLSYLGTVMNIINSNRSIHDTMKKWEILGYSSHHIFFMAFCILWLFRCLAAEAEYHPHSPDRGSSKS